MNEIRFLLNDEWECISDIDPNTSVLDYLRNHCKLTGTKEGCASGDCGACTVVLAEPAQSPDRDGLEYRAINSCIAPVATLHGRQMIAVEHLQQGEKLHPVQRAMVDCHGSQCGFCTPGFVMSMFALYQNRMLDKQGAEEARPAREDIIEALGGNLCRCTGYRPIIDAAVQMFDPSLNASDPDRFLRAEKETTAKLKSIATDDVSLQGVFADKIKAYFAPTSVQVLADILKAHPGARLVAGGTDLCLEFTQFLREVEVLVYTGRVRELLEIEETESMLEIGAAVTYSRCKDLLIHHYPDLHELIDRLGSRQIRNLGTIGGNIGNASPIGDMPPVLIALDAELILRRADQKNNSQTRRLPVADYFLAYKVTAQQPGEFIERILIPKPQPGSVFRAYKISKRLEDDISASCVALNIKLEDGRVADARIALGGMAEIPRRAASAERALTGATWSEDNILAAQRALAEDFSPISDFRASAEYRLRVSQNLLQRLFLELDAGLTGEQLRVTQYAGAIPHA